MDDPDYKKALENDFRYGGTEGIDQVLKEHNLSALILPGEGMSVLIAS